MAGSFEQGIEPSSSIKGGEFLDYMSIHFVSQEELYSVE
jgi:hypothetical protein